jgi:hypothetical protein
LAIKKQKPENAAEVGHRPPETVRKFSFSFFFLFHFPCHGAAALARIVECNSSATYGGNNGLSKHQ